MTLLVPPIIDTYTLALDNIVCDFSQNDKTKENVQTDCRTNASIANSSYDTLVRSLHCQPKPNDLISNGILQSYSKKFQKDLVDGENEKLAKYDEMVSIYNKALLVQVTAKMVDDVSAHEDENFI